MVDLSKFISNKKILNEIVALGYNQICTQTLSVCFRDWWHISLLASCMKSGSIPSITFVIIVNYYNVGNCVYNLYYTISQLLLVLI